MGCSLSSRLKAATWRGYDFNHPAQQLSLHQRDKLLHEFRDISTELEADSMLARTIDAILNLLPVERASVFLVDRPLGVMRTFNEMEVDASTHPSAAPNMKVKVRKTVSIPIASGIAGAVVSSAKSEVVPDAHADPRFNRSIDEKTGFRTHNIIAVPVKLWSPNLEDEEASHHGKKQNKLDERSSTNERTHSRRSKVEVVAVLQALNNQNGSFSRTDISVLEALASLLSGVLARSALIDAALREKRTAKALFK